MAHDPDNSPCDSWRPPCRILSFCDEVASWKTGCPNPCDASTHGFRRNHTIVSPSSTLHTANSLNSIVYCRFGGCVVKLTRQTRTTSRSSLLTVVSVGIRLHRLSATKFGKTVTEYLCWLAKNSHIQTCSTTGEHASRMCNNAVQ